MMNIATIGTGSIVDAILSAINELEDVTCTAMYSRKRETAQELAGKYGVDTIYTDLESLFSDTNVDLVYIASPNSMHYEQAYQALQHGKHVVCEKPFTSTLEEAETLIALAKEKNLLLFEAISNIHLPNIKVIQEQLPKLGPIKLIQCNYSQYSRKYNDLLAGETPNVFNPHFSGGALMDINIYNLHLVMNLFGSPNTVSYTANQHANGIDTSGVVVLKYPEFIAECVGAKDTNSMNFVLIQGRKVIFRLWEEQTVAGRSSFRSGMSLLRRIMRRPNPIGCTMSGKRSGTSMQMGITNGVTNCSNTASL